MAPLDFKHMTSADYKPGESDEVKYYAQKRKKQYHGNESVQSADRKPEKYIKPDGKVGIRMVRTDKEIVKKEAIVDPNDLKGRPKKADPNPESPYGIKHPLHPANLKKKKAKSEASAPSVLKPTKPSDITKHARTLAKNPGDYERNKKKYIDKARSKVFKMYPRESLNGLMKEELLDEAMKQTHIVINPQGKVIGYATDEKGAKNLAKTNIRKEKGAVVKLKTAISNKKAQDMMGGNLTRDMLNKLREEARWPDEMPPETDKDVDEALNLQQRMKRSRLMKRMKTRIKIGRERAKRKMAPKDKLEKRAMRQARNQIVKKLTRGIPKAELSFARKQEIEKRLDKPMLKQRIKRIAKRIFKDVRKKEVQRKKG